ncbi:Uma2 family endonuclease [Moorella sp. E306M]|uniref:Uma2 family endonuclease n=1 Tax=Moorella sp. E306M TaxID=2572683 RepID=UPI0010FFACD0|nr:Uma2 family endonuclease [Moorella sp. E306M]GEA17590.1 restriction endonuclease [Moorella sp. E306M]
MGIYQEEMIIPVKNSYTYEDYARLPEGTPFQLIGGKLIMTPAPDTYHQIILMRLIEKLLFFLAGKDLGILFTAPVDVFLEEKETYQPDIIFIAKDRMHIIETTKIKGAPDLVIEILSPSTGYYDLKKKARVYARCGVKEYWIVDPEDKSIEVFQQKEGNFVLVHHVEETGQAKSILLKGFAVEVKEIFAPLQ